MFRIIAKMFFLTWLLTGHQMTYAQRQPKEKPIVWSRYSDAEKVAQINEWMPYYRDHNGDSASLLALWAYELAIKNDLQESLPQTLLNLGEVKLDQGQYHGALADFRQARQIAREQGAPVLENKAMQLLAVSFHFLNQSDSALYFATSVLNFFRKNNLIADLATVHSFVGYVYKQRGLHGDALHHFQQGLKLRQTLSDDNEVAKSFNALGSLHLERERYSEAMSFFLQAYEFSRRNGVMRGIVSAQTHMGYIHYKLQAYDEAITALKSSLYHSEQSNLKREVAQAATFLSLVYLQTGQKDSSQLLLNKAIGIRTALADTIGLIETLTEYSVALYADRQYVQARERLDQAERMLGASSSPLLHRKVYAAQANVYMHLDDEPAMVERLKRMLAIDNKEGVDMVAIELFKTKKDLEMVQQLAVDDREKAAYQSSRQMAVILICVSLIAALCLTLYFNQWRSNQRIRRQSKLIREKNLHLEDANLKLLHLNEELQQSQAKLMELNQTKDRFFSIIGHDLRSPLASLAMYLDEFVLSDQSTDPVHKEAGQQLRRAVMNLNELINNLLTWALSQSGKVSFIPREMCIRSAVGKSISLLNPIAEAKQIQLSIKADADPKVMADPDMFDLIARNLISNAIKFTPEGGTVQVRIRTAEAFVLLEVTDTGVGIPAERLEGLFTFSRIRSTKGTNLERGAGLGLILVKDYVERHGGRIEVVSRVGQGSTFRVILPQAIREPVAERA